MGNRYILNLLKPVIEKEMSLKYFFAVICVLSFVSTPVLSADSCPEEVGYFKDLKQAYEENAKLNAPKVRCMALAGDDRAATLYAEYLLEKYNDNGYKEDIQGSYVWYRIAVERSKSPGSWKQMPATLEAAVAGIREDSNALYETIKSIIAPRKRFLKPNKIVLPEETPQERKKRLRKARESGGPRIPSHRQKVPDGYHKQEIETESYVEATPMLIFLPIYPSEALEKKIEGYVTFQLDIDAEGQPIKFKIVKSFP